MKSCLLSVSLFSLAGAFSNTNKHLLLSSSSSHETRACPKTILFADASASAATAEKRKPLGPNDILAQQRAKQGLPDPDKHPKLYSDDLLDDMKEVLLILEKRVQGGQGSIGAAEVEKFVAMSSNILVEMKQKEYERLNAPSSTPASVSTSDSGTTTDTTSTISSKELTNTGEESTNEANTEEVYEPEVEGPDYDPAGGQGSLPKDTTNTYIIPGMDEMSPEEYQKALQQSIIDRQNQRKSTGTYGNRNTWDYLNNLSGETGMLKKDPLED